MIEIKLHSDPLSAPEPITMPGGWAELTGVQFLNVASALYTFSDANERHAHICLSLMGGEHCRRFPAETLIAEVFPLLDWIYTQPAVTEQLIPAVQVGLSKYYGPEGHFNNLKLVEFDFAERELYLFLKEREAGENGEAMLHLWRFVACLYRPGKWLYNKKKDKDGDIRTRFNENMLNYYARKLRRHLPDGFAYAVHLWYKACRERLVKLYPVVFSGGRDNAAPANELPNHFNLIRKIAEKGTYGNFDAVEHLYLHTVLLEIEKSIIEAEEIKTQTR